MDFSGGVLGRCVVHSVLAAFLCGKSHFSHRSLKPATLKVGGKVLICNKTESSDQKTSVSLRNLSKNLSPCKEVGRLLSGA